MVSSAEKQPDLGVHSTAAEATLFIGLLFVPEEAQAAKALLYLPGRMVRRRPRPYASGSCRQHHRSGYKQTCRLTGSGTQLDGRTA